MLLPSKQYQYRTYYTADIVSKRKFFQVLIEISISYIRVMERIVEYVSLMFLSIIIIIILLLPPHFRIPSSLERIKHVGGSRSVTCSDVRSLPMYQYSSVYEEAYFWMQLKICLSRLKISYCRDEE